MIKLSAAGSGSFSPTVQLEKREMHMVFLHFSSFYLDQNLSLAALADRISSYTGSGILHKAESDLRSLSSIHGPFIQHNVQNDAVHHRGSVIPQADKIRYCLCCILLHDPFIRLYADASHGHGAQMKAELTQVATFRAQSAFAPSQSIPATPPIMLFTARSSSTHPPPIRYTRPHVTPVAAIVAPHNDDRSPKRQWI